jgi:2',3'-cyclic-nucleotide 2'-phosphodiesterase/3'-nucleotidase
MAFHPVIACLQQLFVILAVVLQTPLINQFISVNLATAKLTVDAAENVTVPAKIPQILRGAFHGLPLYVPCRQCPVRDKDFMMSSILALHPITRRSLLSGVAATSALVLLHPFAARAAANQAHLRIMETTDIHVHVFPYDYYSDKPNDTLGLARTASIIDKIRAEAGNSFLVDNGDFLQGNPMGDYMAYQHGMKEGDVHPVIKAMNVLGYEAGTLGNHEFNYGLDYMFKVLSGANFPYVCANLTKGQLAANPKDDTLFFKPYTIVEKTITDGSGAASELKIGIIGFVPPQIMLWDIKNLEGKAQTRDIVEAARAWVPVMKEE